MTNVSRTNQNGKRPKSDLYPTPADATRSFVRFERAALMKSATYRRILLPVWEPAAGECDLAVELLAAGFPTYVTDLHVKPGRLPSPPEHLDFMATDKLPGPNTPIVTNPPYSVGHSGDEFVRHALRLRPRYAAFFLPLTFLAGLNRADLLEGEVGGLRMARVLILAWRCTLKPSRLKLKNSGVVSYAWFIWERGHKGPWIPHRLYRNEMERTRYLGAAGINGQRYARPA